MWFRGLRVSKGLKAQRVDLALKELKAPPGKTGERGFKGPEGPEGGVSSIYDLDDGYRVDDLESDVDDLESCFGDFFEYGSDVKKWWSCYLY